MKRIQHDSEELRRIARDHLSYEIDMLYSTFALIPDTLIQSRPVLRSAVIESFALHTRVLLDFFFGENPKSDDLVANDYFQEDPEYWDRTKRLIPGFQDIKLLRRRTHKQVAHLTYNRLLVTPHESQWKEPGEDALHIIEAALREFLLNAPADLLDGTILVRKSKIQDDPASRRRTRTHQYPGRGQ